MITNTSQTQKSLSVVLDEIEERANKATPGPWAQDWGRVRDNECGDICIVPRGHNWQAEPWLSDKAFIAAARADVPNLVKALRRAVEVAKGLTLSASETVEIATDRARNIEKTIVSVLNGERDDALKASAALPQGTPRELPQEESAAPPSATIK